MKEWIARYAHKDEPVPEGSEFVLAGGHHGLNGYGIIVTESKPNFEPQILIAVYDDGILLTVDGKSGFKKLTKKQMLWLAQDLIKGASKDD